jgi:SAM-dependent methyltransferase
MEFSDKYSSVVEIFQNMTEETMDGVALSDIVGGGDPLRVAVDGINLIARVANLKPTDNVLDLGCGCGRTAAALTQHLASSSRYYGIDIVPGLIEFSQRRITSRFENFQFFTIDQDNSSYDYFRTVKTVNKINSIEEVCGAGSIDLCISMSLFTHLNLEMAKSYLLNIYNVLNFNGRAYITVFLLDAITRAIIKGGEPSYRFSHMSSVDGVYYERPDAPMHAVAFDESTLRGVLVESGFYIDQILYGDWAGRRNAHTHQDVVVLRKLPSVVGFVHFNSASGVVGWAAAKNGSSEPIMISIHADGKPIGSVCADEFRSDLVSAGYGTGHHGFRWTPASPLPEQTVVTVYAGSGEQIPSI